MKFDLQHKEERDKAQEYLDKLKGQYCVVDITRKFNRRTYSQNNYLHLLLSYCALEMGETLDYFKENIWKGVINKDIFLTQYRNPKTGAVRDDWKSSADLDTKEMTIAIERLLDFAPKHLGFELPSANDHEALRQIENQIESNRRYL